MLPGSHLASALGVRTVRVVQVGHLARARDIDVLDVGRGNHRPHGGNHEHNVRHLPRRLPETWIAGHLDPG